MSPNWRELWAWLQVELPARMEDERGLATLLAGLLLLLISWVAGQMHKRRQVTAILDAVDDTTFGRLIPHVRTGAWGFAVALEPAPEPFRRLSVSYRALSILDLLDWGAFFVRRERPRLQFSGFLAAAPEAEILWVDGRPPLSLLGTMPGTGPWIHQRLEITQAEYAIRGANPGALRHAFADLHARFHTTLALLTVQRERSPEVRLVVEGRIDPRALSPLLTSLRAIGRAALRD